MKIAQKLTLCLVAVTGALFLVGGYWMVSQNFEASLEQAAAQNAAQHTAQRLSVEDAALRLAMQQASGNPCCTPRAQRLPPPCRRRSLP